MAATGCDGGIDGGNATGGGGGGIILPNPSATTEEAIRSIMLTVIAAITPGLLIRDLFRAYNESDEFTAWCESAPDACFRRFSVRDTGDTDGQFETNTTEERRHVIFSVLVAYPDNYRYGADQGRDQDDVMVSDRYLLEGAVGLRGYGNFTNASFLTPDFLSDIQRGRGVAYTHLRIGFEFTRSTP
jgi:hypothetical protein